MNCNDLCTGGDEEVAACRRRPAPDDHYPSAVPRHGPELPYRAAVRGPHGRRGRRLDEGMQPEGTAHDVHLEDGPDIRQGSILCVRSRFLWHLFNRSEGAHHGPELHARQEGGSVCEEHPEVRSYGCVVLHLVIRTVQGVLPSFALAELFSRNHLNLGDNQKCVVIRGGIISLFQEA